LPIIAPPRQHVDSGKPQARSRTTNGKQLLDGIDGRSTIARHLRDILQGLLVEFEVDTEADELLIRRAATLSVISEQLQTQIVNGERVDFTTVTNLSGNCVASLATCASAKASAVPHPRHCTSIWPPSAADTEM
jgi:hypothetical protein